MLMQIREFIAREKVVSFQQIARQFIIENQALEPMIDFWLLRGVIAVCNERPACRSKCFKCPSSRHIYYKYCANITK